MFRFFVKAILGFISFFLMSSIYSWWQIFVILCKYARCSLFIQWGTYALNKSTLQSCSVTFIWFNSKYSNCGICILLTKNVKYIDDRDVTLCICYNIWRKAAGRNICRDWRSTALLGIVCQTYMRYNKDRAAYWV